MIRTTILLQTAALSLIMVSNTTQAADPSDRFNPYTGEYNEPTQHTIVVYDHGKAVVHRTHKKEVSGEVKVKFVDNKADADAKPAVEGSVNELDKAGEAPYQWTQRYIEQAMGVGVWSLISPNVTFGPYATIYNGQHCWMCKVTFHVQGDNRQHYAIVYEEPVMGAGHVVGCEIDF